MNQNLKRQADKILLTAKEYGTEQHFFFTTTFEKYITQLEILEKIKSDLSDDDLDDVKLMMAYNKVVDSSNKTLSALIRLITTLRTEKDRLHTDPLWEILCGKSKKNE